MAAPRQDHAPSQTAALDYDVIIIGAGLSGMYQLYRLREMGLRVRVFETGTGVGGTWYWNRYPGARFDSESYSYGYSFSKELLQEWEWSEHFAGQPETLRYCNYVADKFDLRRDIQFESRVTAAIYQDDVRSWQITLESGARHTCRFLITAIGPLSTPTLPRIEGRDSFKGQSFHTARWPKQKVDFTGKRVAVIGTGATGIQTIQTIAAEVGHLTVFQRTANWARRRCTTARSMPRPRRRSRPAIPRSSRAARRPLPASSTPRTRAARSRSPTRSARRSMRSSMASAASASGRAISMTS
ncbi:NAD(P)/FAD-dependent oxidoreductase [Bradyrhizobium sp. ISRA435]|nr:NAD(P)/FAD-dependent oxidoreductase [Bradyrhizobium sp. ISRA435]